MSKWIWIVLIIILIVIGLFVFSSDDSENMDDGEEIAEDINDAPDSDFSNLNNADDVFNEIDNALEEIG